MAEKDKKFFFDMHSFDEVKEEEEEDLPPPPPTFSEEELSAEKIKGYKEGYAKAQEDEKAGRDQAIATTLSRIASNISPLVIAETEREKRFEQEAVHLVQHIFKTLYPHYASKCGFEELKSTLNEVLENNRTETTIQIYVAQNMLEGITTHLNSLSASQANLSFEVSADPTLEDTACRLSWKEGGASHNPEKIALSIQKILVQELEHDGFTVDSEEKDAAHLTNEIKDDIVDDSAHEELQAQPDAPDNQGEIE
ncbi:MAG: hypothetical protein KTR28_00430 [Micavibrio sp.]|nr:hypothetical protein [Micavibrio sp.]